MKKILAIDGGGIRGIIPASVLMELEAKTGKRTAELFDLIAGTSTGGILALGLTKTGRDGRPEYTAQDMVKLYTQHGKEIFEKSFFSDLKSGFGLWGERFTASNLKAVLDELYGDSRLKDAFTEVLIPAYEIERRIPYFFKRHKARTEVNGDFSIIDVCLATSAAPTYFSPARLKTVANGYLYCADGGLFANNPAADAVTEARKLWPGEELLVVSLGTGRSIRRIPYEKANGWGAAKWLSPLLESLFDATAMDTDYRLRSELPAARYFRLQIDLSEDLSAMSEVSKENIEALTSVAYSLVEAEDQRMDTLCNVLTGKTA